jgi:hypothetical protein
MALSLKNFDPLSIPFRQNHIADGPIVAVIGRHNTAKTVLIRDLLFYHKDNPIGTIIEMEYPNGTPRIYDNIDYVFILRENIPRNREKIWEAFGHYFSTFESFCSVMDQTTSEDYECLVIHLQSKSKKIADQLFWYKASLHPDFEPNMENINYFCNNHTNDEVIQEINRFYYRRETM